MPSLEDKARELSRPALEAIGHVLDRWNISPDWVTVLGLVLTAGVATLAALGHMLWAGIAYVFASLCDSLDGSLARVSGKGSRFGAFLDSTIDRFEESLVFLGLIIFYSRTGGTWQIPLIFAATIGSLMVSYTRARAEGVGVACKEGIMTRPVRVVIMIAGLILNLVTIAVAIVAAASLLTSFERIYHVWRATGGERGGWKPAKTPFVMPSAPAESTDKEENQSPS